MPLSIEFGVPVGRPSRGVSDFMVQRNSFPAQHELLRSVMLMEEHRLALWMLTRYAPEDALPFLNHWRLKTSINPASYRA